MKRLIWIIVLFAVAAASAIAVNTYSGDVYIVVNQTMVRLNLHAFALAVIILVIVLYLLIKLIAVVADIPSYIQRFSRTRKRNQTMRTLNSAGLAYFEGRFQKAAQKAAKVLSDKAAGENHALALILGAHAASQMNDTALLESYLDNIAALPAKQQLSRHLLLADSALKQHNYPAAESHLAAAAGIYPKLTHLFRLQLRYALDTDNPLEVLDKTKKLVSANAISSSEAEHYQNHAYNRLLALAANPDNLKNHLKYIPEHLKTTDLCIPIAKAYQRLNMHRQAVKWVSEHYPKTQQPQLLEILQESFRHLDEKEQRYAIDNAENWLKTQPKNSTLLMHLGQLAYHKQLWGKAQSYLESSIALKPEIPAYLTLAKVFDVAGQYEKAEIQRKLALTKLALQYTASYPSNIPSV